MGDVSNHFSRSEFACKCGCGFNAVDVELLDKLEMIRSHFDKPVHITNACRCLNHNRSIGSKDTSQHIKGLAVDIYINGIEPQEIADYVDEFLLQGKGGIGIYKDFVHIDIRKNMARWRRDE
jgi:uncharacterized protein YcbK (DUF882 family)